MLPGGDTQPGGEASSVLEDVRIAHARYPRRGSLWADRLDLHQPACRLTGFSEHAKLTIVRADPRIYLAELLEQPGEHLACKHWQPVLRILEDSRQLAP